MAEDKKAMTLMDGLVVMSVILTTFWIIFSGITQKNPDLMDKIKGFLEDKKITKLNPVDRIEQVYDERRGMM